MPTSLAPGAEVNDSVQGSSAVARNTAWPPGDFLPATTRPSAAEAATETSRLAKTGFREYEKVFSKTSHVYYDQYLDPDFAGEDEEKANDALKREFTEHSDKDYYFMADSVIGKWKPDKFHYGGNVYVVTNDKVMSAAAYFATLVQHSGVGKIVGDGTTGGSSSSNGYNTLQYILPESGIKFYFPFAHFIYTYKDQKNNGMGIRPDWLVPDTYESFKENSDHQVSFIVDSLILN